MRKTQQHFGLYLTKANPLLAAWSNLMMTSGQIALASGQTIMHRMLMMSTADFSALTAAQRREFTRMYTEKVQAMMAYGQIMALELLRLDHQLLTLVWSQFVSNGMAMTMLSVGRNPSETFSAQSRFVNAASQRASDAAQEFSTALVRAAAAGLKPMHTRVSANAKRLGRKRR